jgi:hypothetical protein
VGLSMGRQHATAYSMALPTTVCKSLSFCQLVYMILDSFCAYPWLQAAVDTWAR